MNCFKKKRGECDVNHNLTYEEQRLLFISLRENPSKQIEEILYKANENLVLYALNKYKNRSDYEDILQEGRIGLLYAIRHFDVDSQNQFSTYAYPCISKYAVRFILQNETIHIPINEKTKALKMKKDLSEESEEIVISKWKKNGCSKQDISKYIEILRYENIRSMDKAICNEDCSIWDVITDKKAKRSFIQIENKQVYCDLLNLIYDILGPDKYETLISFFGINGPAKTYREIAELKNISPEKAHNDIGCCIRLLRHPRNKSRLAKLLDVPGGMTCRNINEYLEEMIYGNL